MSGNSNHIAIGKDEEVSLPNLRFGNHQRSLPHYDRVAQPVLVVAVGVVLREVQAAAFLAEDGAADDEQRALHHVAQLYQLGARPRGGPPAVDALGDGAQAQVGTIVAARDYTELGKSPALPYSDSVSGASRRSSR